MTVSTATSRNDYLGTGTTGPFPYTFRIFANADLRVTRRGTTGTETTLVLTTDYAVTGAGSYNGGSVTLTAALAVGERLTIRRVLSAVQEADFPNQGGYFPETNEDAHDRAMMLLQQLSDASDRSIKLPETEAATAAATTLPTATLRANKVLAFDASGNPTITTGTSEIPESGLVQVVDTVAALKALAVPSAAITILVRGYAAAGDLGGGTFRWVAGSSDTPDLGMTFQPDAGGLGRWKRLDQGAIDVRWFGAKGDGTTDDRAAIQSAIDTGLPVFIPPGSYKILSGLVCGAGEQTVRGAGAHETFILADNGAAPLPGAGVFEVLAQHTTISDLAIIFTQPTTSVRASLIAHPPAIQVADVPRCRFSRLYITQAKTGINLAGNSGGCDIEDLEMSSFDIGIRIGTSDTVGALDSIKINRWHQYPFGCTGGVGGVVWVTVAAGAITAVSIEQAGADYPAGPLSVIFPAAMGGGTGGAVALSVTAGALSGSSFTAGSGYTNGTHRVLVNSGTNSIYDDGAGLALLCYQCDDLKVSNSLILRQSVQLQAGFGEFTTTDFDGTSKLGVNGGQWTLASCILSTRDVDYLAQIGNDALNAATEGVEVIFTACEFIGNIVHFPMIFNNFDPDGANSVVIIDGCNFKYAGGVLHNVINSAHASVLITDSRFDIDGFWVGIGGLVPAIQLAGSGRFVVANNIFRDRSAVQDFVNVTVGSSSYAAIHGNVAPGWTLTTNALTAADAEKVFAANNDMGAQLLTTSFTYLKGPVQTIALEGTLTGAGGATIAHPLGLEAVRKVYDIKAWARGNAGIAQPVTVVAIDAANVTLGGGPTPAGQAVTAATNANPAVLTIVGHGLTTGQKVAASGFAGGTWATINGNEYFITVLTADTFSLTGLNSTGLGVWTAGTITLRPAFRVAIDYSNHKNSAW